MTRQRVATLLLCALIGGGMLVPGASGPQRVVAQPDNKVYLPLVAGKPPAPELLAPADGAALSTLAPLISFTLAVTGTYRIEVSATDTFSTNNISSTIVIRDTPLQTVTRPLNSNLPVAGLFFWRVGLIREGTAIYSAARVFTTPAKSAITLPAKPQPISPLEGATVPPGTVTLAWNPVPGALYYRVTVDRPDGSDFYSALLDGKLATVDLANVPAGASLSWKIKVLTASGWSTFAGPVGFSTP